MLRKYLCLMRDMTRREAALRYSDGNHESKITLSLKCGVKITFQSKSAYIVDVLALRDILRTKEKCLCKHIVTI